MVRGERGHTLIEVMVAMAIVTILAGAALSGGSAHLKAVKRSYDDLKLRALAESRLEVLTDPAADLAPGERAFSAPPGVRAVERIRRLEAGLYEITVRVKKEGIPPLVLVTVAAPEVSR